MTCRSLAQSRQYPATRRKPDCLDCVQLIVTPLTAKREASIGEASCTSPNPASAPSGSLPDGRSRPQAVSTSFAASAGRCVSVANSDGLDRRHGAGLAVEPAEKRHLQLGSVVRIVPLISGPLFRSMTRRRYNPPVYKRRQKMPLVLAMGPFRSAQINRSAGCTFPWLSDCLP